MYRAVSKIFSSLIPESWQTHAARAAVDRGIEWLDEVCGEGWPHEIEVDRLDITSGANCPCGQLFDGYLGAYGRGGFRPYEQGFITTVARRETMNRIWKQKVRALQKERPLPDEAPDYRDPYHRRVKAMVDAAMAAPR